MANPYGTGAGWTQQQPGGYAQQAPGGYGQQPPAGFAQQPAVAPGYGAPAGFGAPAGYPGAPPQVDPQVLGWFQAVDMDRSGRISAAELGQALTNSNWSHFDPSTIRLMIGMFDKDYSGQIDVGEFQQLWTYILQWKQSFDAYDRDRSGSIDQNELLSALNTMGYRVSPQFARLIVSKYDFVARSRVTLDSFIGACVLLQNLTKVFRERDVTGAGQINVAYDDFMCMAMANKP